LRWVLEDFPGRMNLRIDASASPYVAWIV